MRFGIYLETLVGRLYIVEEDGCIVELGSESPKLGDCLQETKVLQEAAIQLQEYFAGERCELDMQIEIYRVKYTE